MKKLINAWLLVITVAGYSAIASRVQNESLPVVTDNSRIPYGTLQRNESLPESETSWQNIFPVLNTTAIDKNSTHSNEATNRTEEVDTSLLNVIYWEVKPLIFTNSRGEIDGIFPTLFEQASVLCNQRKPFVRYTTRLDSRKQFYETARSNISYGEGLLTGVNKHKAFWAPVLSPTNIKNDDFLKRKNLKSFQIIATKEISVIVRRDLISLPNKILRGIMACEQIFVLAILLAILFGVLLWVIERYKNNEFPDTFVNGVGIGLYWSIVSMTTVGYGDIQPKTTPGRFITCFWLFIGVMIGCIMTATLTDVVNGNDFDVQNKRISVLANSFEEQVAAKQYQVQVVPVQSYQEVIDMVRSGEVFGAMMNSDIASWYKNEISDDTADVPLRMVEKLPANLYVQCFMPSDLLDEVKAIFKCMYFQQDEVYTFSKDSFRLHHPPETLYIGSTADLLSTNIYVRALIGVLGGLLVIGILYDLWRYFKNRKEKSKETEMQKLC